MKSITHDEQQKRWDQEHTKPTVLLQMDSRAASGGVEKFWQWLREQTKGSLSGIEMCCGKGRNVIGLARQGARMIGADFSPAAVAEAKKRAKEAGVDDKAEFIVHDVTLPYPVAPQSLDFAIDCFGSTDIETKEQRQAASTNLASLLKPGGYLLAYLLSTDDAFHKEMIRQHPGPDPGSFIHPVNGKYEKAFTESEAKQLYGDLHLVTLKRIPKKAVFFNKEYDCNHIWAVFQKPLA